MKEYLEKRREELRKENGFTLMEMLIVVAIIAILIAIAIPVFTSQLERSREAADGANIRAMYAEVMTSAIANPASGYSKSTKLAQQQNGWQTSDVSNAMNELGKLETAPGTFSSDVQGTPSANGSATVSWIPGSNPEGGDAVQGHIQISFH